MNIRPGGRNSQGFGRKFCNFFFENYIRIIANPPFVGRRIGSFETNFDLAQVGGRLMKTIFRFLSFAAVLAAFGAVATTASYAQSEACADVDGQTAVYTKFTEIYAKKTLAEMETAAAAGKEFLEKYGACETLKDQIAFVKPQTERLEKAIPIERMRVQLVPLFARYDAAIKSDNADEVYASGKEILAITPDNLNIIFPMAVVGIYQSTPANNYKYADDGLRYTTLALSKIKGGAEFTRKTDKGEPAVGVLKYTYTKPDAIDELTYALAYLNYYGKKDKKTALPYYYELSQSAGPIKTIRVFTAPSATIM